jgi:hypothetical protein
MEIETATEVSVWNSIPSHIFIQPFGVLAPEAMPAP